MNKLFFLVLSLLAIGSLVNGEQGPMVWATPCDDLPISSQRYVALSDTQLLQNITLQAENASLFAEAFKDQYVKETFQLDFMAHHNNWKDKDYDWLPKKQHLSIPKSLGIPIDPSRLQNIQLDDFLRWTYTYLQLFSVTLEQVASDQGEDGNTAYQERFRTLMLKLRPVLCELLMTMKKRKVKPYPDVVRAQMPSEFRHIDSFTHRNLRDWIIFRDCLSMLEYVTQVSKYFVDNPDRLSAEPNSVEEVQAITPVLLLPLE